MNKKHILWILNELESLMHTDESDISCIGISCHNCPFDTDPGCIVGILTNMKSPVSGKTNHEIAKLVEEAHNHIISHEWGSEYHP